MTTQEHAQRWLSHNERVARWVGGSPSEDQQRRDFKRAGVPILRPTVSDVEAGIDRIIQLIKPRRLIVFRTCTGILDEIGTYSREVDDNGQPTEKIKDKSTFHRIDALRYISSVLTEPLMREAKSVQWI